MERCVRLRQTGVVCAATALALSLWSCGRGGPSDPTLVSSPGQLTVAGSSAGAISPLTGPTTTWSCLTAGQAGLFSSATGCETATGTLHTQGRVGALAAPGPSGNLTGSVSGSTVTLTWLAPASADATSYVIEAGSFPGAINLASFDTGTSSTTLTVTAVPPGTYYVRARAKNSTGTSAPSNEIVLNVGGSAPCSGPPGVPSGLNVAATGSSVMLTWNTPGGGCAPTTYVVEAGSSPGASNLANFSTGSAATAFSASGVSAGTYYVRVRAANGSGTSGPSNEGTLIVGGGSAPPPTPSPTLSVRWVGLAPEGMVVVLDPYDQCPAEYDLQLDLTTSGTTVTGTANTRLRRVEAAGPCGDVLGEVATWSVINGKVEAGTISFALGSGTFRFSGTLTATRMTGTVFIRELTPFTQTGSFAVNRQ
jgi:hypothetical protein